MIFIGINRVKYPFKILCSITVYGYVNMCTCLAQQTCEDQKSISKNQFSPATMDFRDQHWVNKFTGQLILLPTHKMQQKDIPVA